MNERDLPSSEEVLAHFGVKGMHWGHRKAQTSSPVQPTKTTKADRELIDTFGRGGQRRINKSLAKGRTVDAAISREDRVDTALTIAKVGGALALTILAGMDTSVLQSSIHNRAETNRAAAAMPKIMASASKVKYSKIRGGAYNITTL